MLEPRPRSLGPVVIWLIVGCALIACMVALGGMTRLTGSGLSITEWKPIMGALPPMNEREWDIAFVKYKAIPQYRLINQHLDLAGFKRIFFWEYLHRNWGRLMGLAFIVPFLVFWRQGRLTGWLMQRSIAILIAGGLVGALGWFMVMSGLEDDPDVSQYRLAIHLCTAFAVFGLVLWTVLDVERERRSFRPRTTTGGWARWLLLLLLIQIVWGAFTAGLDAGRVHNTWPWMSGEFMPASVRAHDALLKDFTDHKDGVQFIHRNMAWLVAAGVILFARRAARERALAGVSRLLVVAVLLQFVLGVITVLTQVNIVVGVMHQLGALLLLSLLLWMVHATGRPVDAGRVLIAL